VNTPARVHTFGSQKYLHEFNNSNRTENIRVTRLGEFSPNGRFFTFASLLKITKVATLFVLHFP
jgi:hypothetical protein